MNGVSIRVIVCVAAFLAFAPPLSAQLVGDPAGPRTGTIYELSLRPPDPATLQRLNELGFNIGHVSPAAASIFATRGEYDYLLANGYAVTLSGTQPSPPEFPRIATRGLGVYHSYAALSTELQAYATNYPAITRLISLGPSVQGRQLWALLISDNPLVDEDEPEFKYVSTMHGDEPVGAEMCLYLIDHLLTNYGVDSDLTDLVDETAIWFVPLMNPDGLELGTRFNADGIDLNRDFPEYPGDYSYTVWNGGAPNLAGRAAEVVRLMNWSYANSFALSANLHTGAVVVSYPYDADPPLPSYVPAPTPDHTLFLSMANDYAALNPPMLGNNSPPFANGTVNGNDWYIVNGSMQDWLYRYLGDPDVTIELSVPKKPAQWQLPTYWSQNRDSMLAYLAWAQRGVRGVVTDQSTGDPLFARVTVVGNSQPVFTDPDVGDYHRLLPPGTYTLQVESLFYETATVPGVIVGAGDATRLDVQLVPLVGLRGASSLASIVLAALFMVLGAAAAARFGRRVD